MTIFGLHICQHEIMAAMAALPVLGYCVLCAKRLYHKICKRHDQS